MDTKMGFMDSAGPYLGAAVVGAVIYFSPLSQNGIFYVAGQAAAARYGYIMLMNSSADQKEALTNSAMVAGAAAAGFMAGPYVSLDPILTAAIAAPVLTMFK
jgi:hypothetical protein